MSKSAGEIAFSVYAKATSNNTHWGNLAEQTKIAWEDVATVLRYLDTIARPEARTINETITDSFKAKDLGHAGTG